MNHPNVNAILAAPSSFFLFIV